MKRLIMLAALPALLLAGCAAQSAASGTETLTVTGSYPLQYAQQFTIDECEGGYHLIIIDGTRYLVVPEGENAPAELDADITVLQQPIENIYLVSSSAMDPIISIDGLDTVALSGTQADNWYLDAAKTAMKNGQIAYAGKYSAPDYETILAANCGLAIENTMIYHTPEVKEQLEKFGVPVLVERSSYESGPLARMEWVKLCCWARLTRPSRSLTTPCSALHRWKMNPPPAKPWRSSPSPPIIWPLCARAAIMSPK